MKKEKMSTKKKIAIATGCVVGAVGLGLGIKNVIDWRKHLAGATAETIEMIVKNEDKLDKFAFIINSGVLSRQIYNETVSLEKAQRKLAKMVDGGNLDEAGQLIVSNLKKKIEHHVETINDYRWAQKMVVELFPSCRNPLLDME